MGRRRERAEARVSALPAIGSAKLPDAYVDAKDALAKCEKIDELIRFMEKRRA